MAEEEQKEEVRRTVLAQLQRAANKTATGALKTVASGVTRVGSLAKMASVGAARGLASAAAAQGDVATKAVVPFVPITLVCRDVRYYVDDPSHGTAPGVVKDSADKEIAGKLELLKVGRARGHGRHRLGIPAAGATELG